MIQSPSDGGVCVRAYGERVEAPGSIERVKMIEAVRLCVDRQRAARIAEVDELQAVIHPGRHECKRSAADSEHGNIPCSIQLFKGRTVRRRGRRNWTCGVTDIDNLHSIVPKTCHHGICLGADRERGDTSGCVKDEGAAVRHGSCRRRVGRVAHIDELHAVV